MPYTAMEEARNVLRLDDGKLSSFYLVKGEKTALLIDTGMADEPLLPYLRTLTDLPIVLLVTHGHGDHVKRANEFDTVYMNPKDIPLMEGAFRRLGITDAVDTSSFLPVEDGQTLSLGEFTVSCVEVGGHTPGSMVFYEQSHHLLFTGDAVGSGVGVWLQLPGCLPLSAYREGLNRLDAFWAGLPEDTLVLSGHYGQQFMHPSGRNPVCRGLVQDMAELAGLILEGREDRQPAPEMMIRGIRPAYTASHGRAAMVYTDQSIR